MCAGHTDSAHASARRAFIVISILLMTNMCFTLKWTGASFALSYTSLCLNVSCSQHYTSVSQWMPLPSAPARNTYASLLTVMNMWTGVEKYGHVVATDDRKNLTDNSFATWYSGVDFCSTVSLTWSVVA